MVCTLLLLTESISTNAYVRRPSGSAFSLFVVIERTTYEFLMIAFLSRFPILRRSMLAPAFSLAAPVTRCSGNWVLAFHRCFFGQPKSKCPLVKEHLQ